MKKIAILGSTGSIGTQALDIVRSNEDLEVVALAAGNNVELMQKQINEFHPQLVVMWNEAAAYKLKEEQTNKNLTIMHGMEGLLAIATMSNMEILITAIVGMIGIRPTLAAIKAGKNIALANKETLVCAGHIIMPLAKQYGVSILPVDSEHSAIVQSLNVSPKHRTSTIFLT